MSEVPEYMSAEDYLALPLHQEEKLEFHNGKLWAMSGGHYQHSIICSNVNRRAS